MNELTIAIGSTHSIPGDVPGNLAQISSLAKDAAANGAALLLTPELSASGYGGYPEVLATAERAGDGPIFQELAALAQQNELVMLAGFVEADQSHRYLAHYIIWPNGRFVVQRKHRVTPLESPLEPSVELYFDDTEEIGHVPEGCARFEVIEIAGARAAVVICADYGVRGLDEILSNSGVNLLLLPTAAGGKRENSSTVAELRNPTSLEAHIGRAVAHAFPQDAVRKCVTYRRAFAAVNMTGFDGRKLYHGGSGSIVDPSGSVEALLPASNILGRERARLAVGTVSIAEVGS
jgi:predicted amidohydrolase